MEDVKPFTDPVCGMSVRADGPHQHEQGGTTYRFCSARCLEKFRADSARYVTPSAPPAAKPQAPQASTAGTWTCPMHPEIVRDAPGSCPICGMALERMMP